jgi:hypothetical protein
VHCAERHLDGDSELVAAIAPSDSGPAPAGPECISGVLVPSLTLVCMNTDLLIEEIERYLAAVALFRQLGYEPEWVSEEADSTRRERRRVASVSQLA